MGTASDFGALPEPPLTAPPPDSPKHALHPELLRDRLGVVSDAFPGRRVRFAYSVKTNPHPRMIAEALALGMDVEAITSAEASAAVAVGATPDRLILNGPGKWWPTPAAVRCRALFLDDVTEIAVVDSLLAGGLRLEADLVGLRMSTEQMGSRFGVRAEDAGALREAAQAIRRLAPAGRWGVHVHHAQSAAGTDAWIDRCQRAMAGTRVLADVLGSRPSLVDFGGGWRASDLTRAPSAAEEVAATEPDLLAHPAQEWEFEFGKALVEPLGVVYTRVLIPPAPDGSVVVDAGMGDMFEGMVSPHRAYVWREGTWLRVPPGGAIVYGRTCVEHDVLARDLDTSELRFGDVLAFADAGAYDVSLSFDFTNGRLRSGWFA